MWLTCGSSILRRKNSSTSAAASIMAASSAERKGFRACGFSDRPELQICAAEGTFI